MPVNPVRRLKAGNSSASRDGSGLYPKSSTLWWELARGEILVVWEDDDIYLPNHISSHVTAVEDHLWSKPSNVLSDYTSHIQEEDATGRFHASIALSRQGMVKCGGWPLTLRGDFDQQFIASLSGLGVHRDPCAIASPSYVFRWGSAAAYHGQALMRGPEDEAWYAAAELAALS